MKARINEASRDAPQAYASSKARQKLQEMHHRPRQRRLARAASLSLSQAALGRGCSQSWADSGRRPRRLCFSKKQRPLAQGWADSGRRPRLRGRLARGMQSAVSFRGGARVRQGRSSNSGRRPRLALLSRSAISARQTWGRAEQEKDVGVDDRPKHDRSGFQ